MSSRALEEAQEREAHNQLASYLGITPEEADEVGATAEPDSGQSDEGMIYGFTITFDEDANPEIMKKIFGEKCERVIHAGPNLFDFDDSEPDEEPPSR